MRNDNYYYNCEDCVYECNRMCQFDEEEYESLILDAAEDIADLTREIVGLRYALKDSYPGLKDDMLSDLTTRLEVSDLYISLVNSKGYNPLGSRRYINDLYRLRSTGKSWHGRFPFSIK